MDQSTAEQMDTKNESGSAHSQTISATKMPSSVNWQFIFERAKAILSDPASTWGRIKNEEATAKEIFVSYAMVLAAIPVVCQFLRMITFGQTIPFIGGTVRWPFFSGLITSAVTYVLSLVGLFVAGYIAHKLAEKFEGEATLEDGLKLMAYSFTPAYLAGVLYLIPALSVLSILFSIYGLYLFYQGIPTMVKVESRRMPYFGSTILATFLAMFIIGIVTTAISPDSGIDGIEYQSPSGDQKLELPGGVSIDMNKLENTMKDLEKFAPKGQN